ncbi:MAG: hypothetical protein V2G48_01130 [bacterium JZ-2024 1]
MKWTIFFFFFGVVQQWVGADKPLQDGVEAIFEGKGTIKIRYPSGFILSGPVEQVIRYRLEKEKEPAERDSDKEKQDPEMWWEIIEFSTRMTAELFGQPLEYNSRYLLRALYPSTLFSSGMSSRLNNGKELPKRIIYQYPPGGQQEVPAEDIPRFTSQHFYFSLLGGILQENSKMGKKEKIVLANGKKVESQRYDFQKENWEIPAGSNKKYRISADASYWMNPESPVGLAKGKITVISTLLVGSEIPREGHTISLDLEITLKESSASSGKDL